MLVIRMFGNIKTKLAPALVGLALVPIIALACEGDNLEPPIITPNPEPPAVESPTAPVTIDPKPAPAPAPMETETQTILPAEPPPPTAAELAMARDAVVLASNQFAIDLYQQIVSVDATANQYFSPLSVIASLATVAADADSETADEIWNALGMGELNAEARSEALRDILDSVDIAEILNFDGTWQTRFLPTHIDQRFDTSLGTFLETTSSDYVTVPTMGLGLVAGFNIWDGLPPVSDDNIIGGTFPVIELPFASNRLSMLVLNSPIMSIGSLEWWLTATRLASIMQNLTPRNQDAITIPKFELRKTYDIATHLPALGIETAFGDSDEFAQSAYVLVDEDGVAEPTRATPRLSDNFIGFLAERPFIFVVVDNDTGVILSIGKIVNPLQSN